MTEQESLEYLALRSELREVAESLTQGEAALERSRNLLKITSIGILSGVIYLQIALVLMLISVFTFDTGLLALSQWPLRAGEACAVVTIISSVLLIRNYRKAKRSVE